MRVSPGLTPAAPPSTVTVTCFCRVMDLATKLTSSPWPLKRIWPLAVSRGSRGCQPPLTVGPSKVMVTSSPVTGLSTATPLESSSGTKNSTLVVVGPVSVG
ncbi:hypothetical protein D3C77_432580 [compost metagenome]